MKYWLMKTEPETFSLWDLKKKGSEHWDGVRNFGARNNMMAMKIGDLVLIHHSGKDPAVVGVAKVAKEAYPDFTAWDKKSDYYDPKSTETKPIWQMVDVKFVEEFKNPVPLKQVKSDPKLENMVLAREPRLSVQPVKEVEFRRIAELAAR